MTHALVFPLDVDYTLLDNDCAIKALRGQHLLCIELPDLPGQRTAHHCSKESP